MGAVATFAMTSVIVLMAITMAMVAFFAFDNFILGGVISRVLKRWAEMKFDSDCSGDCNQGRNCTCRGVR